MSRKYFFNENYFDVINTPEKAYWLGFISADGYISKRGCLSIGLALKDRVHLEKFASHINYIGDIRTTKNINPGVRLDIYSVKMVKSLNDLGVYNNKTFIQEPWLGDGCLMPHYWRGFFDGDGGFHKLGEKPVASANLSGTLPVVTAFGDFIFDENDRYSRGKIIKHSSIWQIYYPGVRPAQSIARKLYISEPYLDRKKKLADHVLNIDYTPLIQAISDEEILEAKKAGGTWTEAAKILNVSRGGLYKHARKKGFERRKWGKYGQ